MVRTESASARCALCIVLWMACLVRPANGQVRVVIEWVLNTGTAASAAVTAMSNRTQFQSVLHETLVAAYRAVGVGNLTNSSLVLDVGNVSATVYDLYTTPAPAANAEDTGARLWWIFALSAVAGLAAAVAVAWWMLNRSGRRGPVLMVRIN